MHRRQFLVGSGGVVMALPLLEGLLPKVAQADPAASVPPYALFYRKPTGVAQRGRQLLRGCPELFWPDLAKGTLLSDANCPDPSVRSSGELGTKYWKRATLLNGLAHPFIDWGHRCGIVQMFTGARVDPSPWESDPEGRGTLKVYGESLDNRIARELGGRTSALALGVSPRSEGNTGSFLGVKDPSGSCTELRCSWSYKDTFESLFSGASTDRAVFDRMRAQKKSVNDLLRLRLKHLRDNKRLSKGDQERLDLHISNIRDLELLLCDPTAGDLRAVAEQFQNEGKQRASSREESYPMRRRGAELAGRIAALAISCGVTRSVMVNTDVETADTARYDDEWPSEWSGLIDMHEAVSHANLSIPRFAKAHQCADRSHFRMFRSILDKLEEYKIGSGTLVDAGVSLLASDIGQGCHTISDVPYIYVGSAGGRLKTGVYLDLFKGTPQEAEQMSNDRSEEQRSNIEKRRKYFDAPIRLLNTIGAAVGCKNAAGGPLDDFNADNNGNIRGRLDMLVNG